MAGSRDNYDVSPSNIIEPNWETLPPEKHFEFEEHKEQLIKEAKAKFLANFKVDRNNKAVRQRATNLASLRPTSATPKVSNTNELQSLKAYIDEQRDQMQQIIGGVQNDYKRLVRAFDKSTIANFPSHEVELGENTRDSSTTCCHDHSQHIYGMSIDTYPRQSQPPTQIGDKFVDLRMSGPSARERGPSGPVAAGPIFRNELPRHAPEPPRTAQTLNYPVGPSAYSDGQSTYSDGQSAYNNERSDQLFKEDCYPNLHPSQLNFPSHHATYQHHNIASQTHGGEYFPARPRRPERNGQSYEPHRASSNVPQNSNQ
jgi:hypothetical protein